MITAFHTPLDFRDLNRESPGRLRLMLLAAFLYSSALLQRQIRVPATFVTDLGSVPRWLWSLVPPIGPADAGYVLHDWLYQAGGVTRGEADGVLYEAMRAAGVSAGLAWTVYGGVRACGWWSWRKYRRMERVEVEAKAA
jgi:Protein of unknown function (DUF1353)